MKTALLATLIPLGYIIGALITARIALSHFADEDGRYNSYDDHEVLAAIMAILWPPVALGYGIYRLVRHGLGVHWIIDPRSVRDRRARERERAALRAQIIATENARLERLQAQAQAARNGLPWPTMNPFVDDNENVQHNPVGRPPMIEGK